MSPSISGISHIWSFVFWQEIRAYRAVDCPVGSNFVPIEKIPIPIVALDASQKNLSDCQKPIGSKMLRGKTRAYWVVRFFTAQ